MYSIYWKYFLYVLEHKKNVFLECFKFGLYIHAFTHDLSKFLPSEFFSYARLFYAPSGTPSMESILAFQKAWFLHQKRNKHHWGYWVLVNGRTDIVPLAMPWKYVKQMVMDWRGMSRKKNDSVEIYFFNHKDIMLLHNLTITRIEDMF